MLRPKRTEDTILRPVLAGLVGDGHPDPQADADQADDHHERTTVTASTMLWICAVVRVGLCCCSMRLLQLGQADELNDEPDRAAGRRLRTSA